MLSDDGTFARQVHARPRSMSDIISLLVLGLASPTLTILRNRHSMSETFHSLTKPILNCPPSPMPLVVPPPGTRWKNEMSRRLTVLLRSLLYHSKQPISKTRDDHFNLPSGQSSSPCV